jgi:butyryl-CoA dehydrogenase
MLIPRRDLEFHLAEVLDLEDLLRRPRFSAHDAGTVNGVFDAAYALAAARFAPFAAKVDVEEPRVADGRVVLPPETARALREHADAGFVSMAFPGALGGLGLPFSVAQACGAVFASANVAFHSYAMLTAGAANLIAHFGTEEQRLRYLPGMFDGRLFGTMCLSEPQAGSSLADIRTTAVPIGDGRYRISGNKMWISGGEHEMGENIVHLVLARVQGAPAGVKGISLFIVPRRRIDDDGAVTGDNGVTLIGLNHKMGWRGHVNVALAFGDGAECIGEIVGREHHGLGYMFHMMNEARVAVGLCAVGLGYAGYRFSLDYARTRLQGRTAATRDPAAPPVPIIAHPDVRRMLLAQKAWVEGGLDLVLYCARLVDELATADNDETRTRLRLLLELLTPIAKSWPSEFCLEANKLAIQVAGGAGYTRDLPLERLYRDNRLNHIHEGTWGIHGLDLLGRKVALDDGRALRVFAAKVETTLTQGLRFKALHAECRLVASAIRALAGTTRRLGAARAGSQAELALANATLYLDAFGTVAVAWRWLAQAIAAQRALDRGGKASAIDAAERPYYAGKLAACRYFLRYDLPRALAQFTLLDRLDDTAFAMRSEEF